MQNQIQAEREGSTLKYQRKRGVIERLVMLPVLLSRYFVNSVMSSNSKIDTFISNNPDLLIIIGIPKTDKIIMSYDGKIVINQIKMASGKKAQVIKNVLRKSQFKNHIDMFLAAIAESMVLPIHLAQDFYHWIDGAVYNIGKSLKKQ